VSLYRCSRAVSAITLTTRSGQIPPQAVNNSCLLSPYGIQTGQDTPSVELQSLFHSSQILLDIVSVLVRILRDKTTSGKTPSPDLPFDRQLMDAQSASATLLPFLHEEEDMSSQHVDSATAVLVSSCYMRLISILQRRCR
jgi:hypothetical protein